MGLRVTTKEEQRILHLSSPWVQESLNPQKVTNGPEGTVSNRTLKSVQVIYSQLGRLHSTIQEINKDIHVDLHSCLTTQVENLHAVGHFKDEFPTVLNFARNLGNSVYELKYQNDN